MIFAVWTNTTLLVRVFVGEGLIFGLNQCFSLLPGSLLPVPQLPGADVGQRHGPPGPGLPEDAEDQPHALHRRPVGRRLLHIRSS